MGALGLVIYLLDWLILILFVLAIELALYILYCRCIQLKTLTEIWAEFICFAETSGLRLGCFKITAWLSSCHRRLESVFASWCLHFLASVTFPIVSDKFVGKTTSQTAETTAADSGKSVHEYPGKLTKILKGPFGEVQGDIRTLRSKSFPPLRCEKRSKVSSSGILRYRLSRSVPENAETRLCTKCDRGCISTGHISSRCLSGSAPPSEEVSSDSENSRGSSSGGVSRYCANTSVLGRRCSAVESLVPLTPGAAETGPKSSSSVFQSASALRSALQKEPQAGARAKRSLNNTKSLAIAPRVKYGVPSPDSRQVRDNPFLDVKLRFERKGAGSVGSHPNGSWEEEVAGNSSVIPSAQRAVEDIPQSEVEYQVHFANVEGFNSRTFAEQAAAEAYDRELENLRVLSCTPGVEPCQLLRAADKLRSFQRFGGAPLDCEAFALVIQSALRAKHFTLACKWLEQMLLSHGEVDFAWLDRVFASIATGSLSDYRTLHSELCLKRHLLSESCAAAVQAAATYLLKGAAKQRSQKRDTSHFLSQSGNSDANFPSSPGFVPSYGKLASTLQSTVSSQPPPQFSSEWRKPLSTQPSSFLLAALESEIATHSGRQQQFFLRILLSPSPPDAALLQVLSALRPHTPAPLLQQLLRHLIQEAAQSIGEFFNSSAVRHFLIEGLLQRSDSFEAIPAPPPPEAQSCFFDARLQVHPYPEFFFLESDFLGLSPSQTFEESVEQGASSGLCAQTSCVSESVVGTATLCGEDSFPPPPAQRADDPFLAFNNCSSASGVEADFEPEDQQLAMLQELWREYADDSVTA